MSEDDTQYKGVAYMLYRTPRMFDTSLEEWTQHLQRVRAWSETVQNKQSAIREAEGTITLLRKCRQADKIRAKLNSTD